MNDDELIPKSEEKKIPKWLLISYILVTIWGIWGFYAYWNGSSGWVDRGYWQKLQRAANTTYPFERRNPALEEPHVHLETLVRRRKQLDSLQSLGQLPPLGWR